MNVTDEKRIKKNLRIKDYVGKPKKKEEEKGTRMVVVVVMVMVWEEWAKFFSSFFFSLLNCSNRFANSVVNLLEHFFFLLPFFF